MHIIIANPFFPPYAPGGAEYSLEQMCRRFAKQQWHVHVVTTCVDGRPRVEIRDGYEIEYLPSPLKLSSGQDDDGLAYIESPEYSSVLLDQLRKILFSGSQKERILIANNGQCFIPVAEAGKESGIPTIGIVRDTQTICATGSCIDNQPAGRAVPCKGLLRAVICKMRFNRDRGDWSLRKIPEMFLSGIEMEVKRRQLRNLGLQRFDHIVGISDALAMLLKKIPGFYHRRISTIQNFSTDATPALDSEVSVFLDNIGFGTQPYFIVAGKKSYGKGSDVASAAMHLVVKKGILANILFVGKGVLAVGKKEHYIVDHPSVPLPLLLGLVSRAVALVIPGRWQEGLHRTMIDALALGRPIICTEAGAPPVEGVRNGRNGHVVKCNDAGTLADAMTDILLWGDKEKAACKEESLRLFRERFSDNIIMDKWINLFDDLALNVSAIR